MDFFFFFQEGEGEERQQSEYRLHTARTRSALPAGVLRCWRDVRLILDTETRQRRVVAPLAEPWDGGAADTEGTAGTAHAHTHPSVILG